MEHFLLLVLASVVAVVVEQIQGSCFPFDCLGSVAAAAEESLEAEDIDSSVAFEQPSEVLEAAVDCFP